jgi:hypothetical protein
MNDRLKSFAILILCFGAMLFAASCKKTGEGASTQLNTMKRYPIERFHLTYQYGGDFRGTQELFVSDFGRYEARRSKFDLFTSKELRSSDNGSITRIFDIYSIDYAAHTVAHDKSPYLDSAYHIDQNEISTPQQFLESEMKKNFFRNTGIDTIAGKPATKWQQVDGSMTLWIWNCILLRQHSNSDKSTLDMMIKNIDTLWVVDTTKFSIPAGFTITEKK